MDNTDLKIDIAVRQTKADAVGLLIHKLSNSLMQAEPNSVEEKRLISKIAAYNADYNIYKDEIVSLEKQIADSQRVKTETANTKYSKWIQDYNYDTTKFTTFSVSDSANPTTTGNVTSSNAPAYSIGTNYNYANAFKQVWLDEDSTA